MLPKPIWCEDGKVFLIEQTKLPETVEVIEISDAQQMWAAIQRLAVRGAPAIGLAGAFGVYLGLKQWARQSDCHTADFLAETAKVAAYLDSSRPTAVNLHWAVTRMQRTAERLADQYGTAQATVLVQGLLAEAEQMLAEDIASCRAIGEYGADLLEQIDGFQAMLTHCNAGALASSMYGTALAPAYLLQERGRDFKVYSDETRPLLQGSRLTAWELAESGIDVTTICDNMAGVVMGNNWVQAVIVGADRIAANGDTANKIGTYTVAVLAKEHGIPFYVAAPLSTIDFTLADGSGIPIEQRAEAEVRFCGSRQTAATGAHIFNPAFDVTPARYITAIITEKGVAYPPFNRSLEALRQGQQTAQTPICRQMQEAVLATAQKMACAGLSPASFGNVSLQNRQNNLLAITPTGINYDLMQAEDICLLDLQGQPITGLVNLHQPSSELPLHLAIYQVRSDVNAVVHNHAVYSTAFAATKQPLPALISEMTMLAPGDIPVVPYLEPGSDQLAQATAQVFQSAEGCLLANHGAVTAADTLDRAYSLTTILESGAQVAYLAKQLGEIAQLPSAELQAMYEKMKGYGR